MKFKEGVDAQVALRQMELAPMSLQRIHSIRPRVAQFKKDYRLERDSKGWYPFAGKNYVEVQGSAGNPADERLFAQVYRSLPEEEKSLYRSYKLQLPEGMSVDQEVRRLNASPLVEYAEPNYIAKAQMAPNDPYFRSSGGWGQTYDDLWGIKKMDCAGAWDTSQGEGVVVAVIDTGVDYNHEDLAANVWVNADEVAGNGQDDDGNGYVDDVHGYDFANKDADPMDGHGHGTHVSGTIAAVGNNGIGVIGVAPKAKIMALKGLGDNGSGSSSDLAACVAYAADNGARILSNSWGAAATSQTLEETFRYASTKGCLSVAAAGNSSMDISGFIPAAFESVLAVTATDMSDGKASFSNYGQKASIAAPGVEILSLRAAGTDMYGDGSHLVPSGDAGAKYYRANGTSMACPHASGVAALLAAAHPEFSNPEIERILQMTAGELSVSLMGSGRVNAAKAMEVRQAPPRGRLTTKGVLSGIQDIRGTAGGANFSGYSLYYGPGSSPSSGEWILIRRSTAQVLEDDPATQPAEDVLHPGWDTARLEDGAYTLKLVVEGTDGNCLEYRSAVKLKNFAPLFPLSNDILKKGEVFDVRAFIGGAFLGYSVEVGEGRNPSAWSTHGIALLHPGPGENLEGAIATWDTSVLPPSTYKLGDFYTLRITVRREGLTTERTIFMVYLDPRLRKGWPQYVDAGIGSPSYGDVKTADLDKDGIKEIVVVRQDRAVPDVPTPNMTVLVYRADGSLYWSRSVPGMGGGNMVPVIGDLDGDGREEIFISGTLSHQEGSVDKLYGFHGDGTDFGRPPAYGVPGGWPVSLGAGAATLSMADLNQNGENKIIARSRLSSKNLFVVNKEGVVERSISTWVINEVMVVWRWAYQAVGNFDDDPELEIVAVMNPSDFYPPNRDSKLCVFNLDGSVVPGWPNAWGTNVPTNIYGSLAVGDVDGDGYDNVVVTGYPRATNQIGGVFVFEKDGSLLPGWPVLTDQYFLTQAVLADMDGDGRLEISTASGNAVYLLDSAGRSLPGWPKNIGLGTYASNVIGDVDGDGRLDVCAAAGGFMPTLVSEESLSSSGGVYAWKLDGTPIDLNPNPLADHLFTEFSTVAPMMLDDLDGDGRVDIVASSKNNAAFDSAGGHVYKDRFSIYVWGLGTPYNAANMPWPMFQRDNQHSGRLPRSANQPLFYSLRTGAAHGSITVSPSKTSYAAGEIVTLTAVPEGQRSFMGWSGDLTGDASPATLRMDGNKTVSATFELAPWLTSPVAGAVISTPQVRFEWDSPGGVSDRWSYEFSVGTSPGGQDIFIGGSQNKHSDVPSMPLTGNPIYVRLSWYPGEARWLHRDYRFDTSGGIPPTYVLAVHATGGSITKSPDKVAYSAGERVALTAIPEAGYSFGGWAGDLNGNANPSTLTMDRDKTVRALFNRLTYAINADAGAHGSISPSGSVTVSHGENQAFTITPDAGYQIQEVMVDGVSQGLIARYEFSNVTADHVIRVSFIQQVFPPHTITASADANGNLAPSGNVRVEHGASQRFTITPDAGYRIKEVFVDGASQGAISSYTFTNVNSNHAISVSFEQLTCTVIASTGANGSISPNGSVSVAQGANQAFTITPNAGYRLQDVRVDGISQGAIPSYTFSNVTADHTIHASFERLTYTVTASAGANGSISPSGGVVVNHGASQAFTISPSAGYRIQDVVVDGVSKGAITPYLFSGVTSAHSITASFVAENPTPYTLFAYAGANGNISPKGMVSVPAGASRTFTITPDSGYRVAHLYVDGTSRGSLASYTFTNVSANHTIAVLFAPVSPGGNRPPVITVTPAGDKETEVRKWIWFKVDVSDPDGDIIRDFSISGLPTGSHYLGGTFYWFPQTAGVYTVKFTAGDGKATTVKEVKITVRGR